MFKGDVLFRRRGTGLSARAPGIVVRLAGGALAFSVVAVADTVGLLSVTGIPTSWFKAVGVATGILLAPTSLGVWLWWLLFAIVGLNLVVSFTPAVTPSVHFFVRNDQPSSADAVIVLSGGMNDEGRINGQGLSRLLSAMELARERGIPSLALSITQEARKQRTISSEADQRALVALGAPQAELFFVTDVFSTQDEALAFATLARTHGWRRVVVVTSPMHSARACATFEKQGLHIECHTAELRQYSLARLDLPENRRQAFADVLYETMAWLLYKVRGWV